MKVIFLQDVKGVEEKTKSRKFPTATPRLFSSRGLATPAGERNESKLKTLLAETEERKEAAVKAAEELIAKLQKSAEFRLKIGAKNDVFGSVSRADAEKRLLRDFPNTRKIPPKPPVILERPIKTLGKHVILIDFEKELKRGRDYSTLTRLTVFLSPLKLSFFAARI